MSPDSPPNPDLSQAKKENKKSVESLASVLSGDDSDVEKSTGNKDGINDFERRGSENRRNRNNVVASILALALWGVLIFTIGYHLWTTVRFSHYLVASETPVEIEKVQTAVTLVNDTAKTLYSFLGTLVTAVTAYYFKTIADEVND
ncbi:MAG: hypothetical protein AB4060_20910 [Crocosphaera sp.]